MRRLHTSLLSVCAQARSANAAAVATTPSSQGLAAQSGVTQTLAQGWVFVPSITLPGFCNLSTSAAATAPTGAAEPAPVGAPHTVSDPRPRPSDHGPSKYNDRSQDSERYGERHGERYGERHGERFGERDHERCQDGKHESPQSHQLRADLLDAALSHVPTHGWSEAALQAAAQDLNVSPAAVGLLPRREGELVHHFIVRCNAKLRDVLHKREEDIRALPSKKARLAFALRKRLEMNQEHINSWPQALAIAARPSELQHSLHALAVMIDDIWFALGDVSTNETWYLKRAAVGAVYTSAELFMVADYSPNFHETWSMLDRRLEDVLALGDWLQLRPTQAAEEDAWDREIRRERREADGRGEHHRRDADGHGEWRTVDGQRKWREVDGRGDHQWDKRGDRRDADGHGEWRTVDGRREWRETFGEGEWRVAREGDGRGGRDGGEKVAPSVEFTDPQTGERVKVDVRPASSPFH